MWSITKRVDYTDGQLVFDVTKGRKVETFRDLASAEARRDELNAKIEARKAKVEAYGGRLVVTMEGLPKALAMRGRRRFIVLDADGNEVAEYASLDEVPELDEPAAEPTIEQGEAAQPVQPEAVEAPVRGTITDTQAATLTRLLDDGEGGGIFHITDAEIPTLSREDARLLIDSLRGDI